MSLSIYRVYLSLPIQQGTPWFIEHFPDIGSGSLKIMKGGSSKKVIFIWNFSGTPCGGTWDSPGQTMSLISNPFQVFQVPICRLLKKNIKY